VVEVEDARIQSRSDHDQSHDQGVDEGKVVVVGGEGRWGASGSPRRQSRR